ncbi:glycosyltransferase [Cyanobium sp. ATX 6E8]|uniref:glycosyltransferase n=1 Tax=Cyanobium sp. ATX 6E8 TaxID=2823701 RepID=UPI0020CC0AD5|nr:glycosyltransferase [Cyanobium sp. ATX 6E8]MCP9941479.1 glycosyltransferase [Cyanobium sp. ATX 6E8]
MISVIIPFHKDISKLKDSVYSVLDQDLTDTPISFEIIIGNDSNLTSAELKSALACCESDTIPVIVVKNKYKRGPGGNRNSAIDVSSGSYYAFLDADDKWERSKTLLQYRLLKSGANFIASAYTYLEDSIIVSPPPRLLGGKSIFYSRRPIGTSTVIVSRTLLPSPAFTDLWFCQDLALWTTVLKNPLCVYSSLNIPLAVYSRKNGRTSKASVLTLLWAYFHASIISGINYCEAIVLSTFYLVRGLYKKVFRVFLSKVAKLLALLFSHSSFLRFAAKTYFYVSQSLLFDLIHGSNTCLRKRFDSIYEALNRDDVYYVAVNTDVFVDAVERCYDFIGLLGLQALDFQFVDLGVGKGKSLMLLAKCFAEKHVKYPTLGIDISSDLLDQANTNIRSLTPDSNFTLANSDASRFCEYTLSNDFILYAYNPFGRRVFESVIERISCSSHVFIVYVEPVHSDLLCSTGFIQIYHREPLAFETRAREYSLYYRPPSAGA